MFSNLKLFFFFNKGPKWPFKFIQLHYIIANLSNPYKFGCQLFYVFFNILLNIFIVKVISDWTTDQLFEFASLT